MTVGKMASQAGHAFLGAFREALRLRPEIASRYDQDSNGTKVCLKAPNEGQLLRAFREAEAAGLPCSLIIDQHHVHPPHFNGEPIITALGIGPARREECHAILKRFSLYT